MRLEEINISALNVNRANDRHGELENEASAIAWLFNTRENHMKNLAKDIVEQGRIFEPPLVSDEGENYVVFDGNRRVTCLKLLEKPSRAPTVPLQEFFYKLKAAWPGVFPNAVLCQIEDDRDNIDDILYRRHTGTLNGVGQSNWDDRMKDNFVARSGKTVGFNMADEIEQRLAAADLLPENKIPRSNINRFLSSEVIRNRVGFSVKKKEFSFTHEPSVVLKTLHRIAEDFANERVVLRDVWDSEGKLSYLDTLEGEKVLPTESDLITGREKPKPKPKPRPTPKPRPKPKPEQRKTLIPQKEFGIVWTGKMQRIHSIWDELQFRLYTEQHPNAVSVLFRVLLELSVDHYASENNLHLHSNDKLANRVEKVGATLFSHNKIDKKQYSVIKKFRQLDQLVSADTLNGYVHSPNFAPSPKHIEAIWDTLANLIVACLKG